MTIVAAIPEDIPGLVALLNSGYRGEASKKGWTTEADLVQGDIRTNEHSVKALMEKPGNVFLKCPGRENELQGCVFLEKIGEKLYLGMLCVSPLIQAKGIGKDLMTVAENYGREQKCTSVFMKVISVRHELVAWYERQGYRKTGETEPFPSEGSFGMPTQPLEFVILEKAI